jgi:hypothetical protein
MQFVQKEDGGVNIYFNDIDKIAINKKGVINISPKVAKVMGDEFVRIAWNIKNATLAEDATPASEEKKFVPRKIKKNFDYIERTSHYYSWKVGKYIFYMGTMHWKND